MKNTRHKHRFAQLALTLVLALAAFGAQAMEFSADTLRGVKAVAIAVDGVHPDLARYGFSEQKIIEIVESRLAGSGIAVVTLEQARTRPEAAMLEVAVHINRHTNDFLNYFPYNVSLKLKQRLALANAEGAFTSATVWQEGRSGIEQPIYLSRLNDYVGTLVDQFLLALRSQNG